ncbi:D-ribose pyranase [Tropicimonas isoalkanivorans]|uniref:D-ribose pyranase n=1 Tax=Tropicimonas isoalkanivorans TaxID=441112 RepID=A0A1I1MYI1_9RHOB|nr:D-ribose pyranase [Tropicimonas isoalkanivorans]SFC86620.1 D-ribose pyranase [Tropicimonas isoalkanivorans]
MKRIGLLNRHLSALTSSLGHMDEIVLADAGLPMPDGVPVIDLAIVPGLPRFMDVLAALRLELVVEGAVWAEEASPDLAASLASEMDAWTEMTGKPIATQMLCHEAFKARTAKARAIIRTGEVTPYANVILISGVAF